MKESTDPLAHQPSVHIRPAGLQDRSFLRELAQKVFSVYGSYDRYLTEWSDSDETITLIGEIGDERVGLAMLTIYPNRRSRNEAVAELLAIAVEPRFQSKGVGTILLEKVIEEASRLPSPVPVAELHLSVAEGNSRAQRLFARRGFRLSAGGGVYPAGQRALHMFKVL